MVLIGIERYLIDSGKFGVWQWLVGRHNCPNQCRWRIIVCVVALSSTRNAHVLGGDPDGPEPRGTEIAQSEGSSLCLIRSCRPHM